MKRGFTLLELIIVVIILGILVSVATPRFTGGTEKSRLTEAFSLLGALRPANERYAAGSGGSYLVNGTCTGLDTTWTTLKNFGIPACSDPAAGIIRMTRTDGSYSVQINAAGCLCCNNIVGTPCAGYGMAVCPACM
ncbi:MAG: prepilin-type N-terminal cleavage/methylation domain-containing protein [Candidatus Omnitrophica bacterium]|nr:prepilin-type N-terminal cleavage/methylation domain-containing protein [Candidatus Omnitrophota bacterium]